MIEALNLIATITLGLYAGSLLTEAVILVPYWRRMPADEFFRLHGTLGPKLFHYFAPLTGAAVALSIAVPILNKGQSISWIMAALFSACALAIFFIYFSRANSHFADRSIPSDQLSSELTRWATWHWVRTILTIAALAASILGHMDGGNV